MEPADKTRVGLGNSNFNCIDITQPFDGYTYDLSSHFFCKLYFNFILLLINCSKSFFRTRLYMYRLKSP